MASTHDVTQSRALLNGFVETDKNGLCHRRYLHDENEARRALARLLRGDAPLDRDIRDMLASLFDPDNEERWIGEAPDEYLIGDPFTPNNRQLVFKFRSRQRRRDHTRNTQIVQHVFDRTESGISVNDAVAETADKFGLSDKTVWDLWSDYEHLRNRGIFDH